MSYAILRHNKVKSSTKGAAISHNHRLGDDDKVNIDKGKKHLNRCFFGEGAQGRLDAKLPGKYRKDAVVSVEILLTSGPEFFDGIEPDREKLAKNPIFLSWLAKSIEWAKKEFGSNLVDATLHMDESSPHIHLLTVPLTKDGRLCAKEVTARKEMQRRQTGYAEAMKPLGLVRGEPATETKRRHIGLKQDSGSGGRASQLAAQLAKISLDYEKSKIAFGKQQTLNISNFHLINKLEAEQKTMNKTIQTATARDLELVAEITELRKINKDANASIEQLQAVNRVLVDQARERLAAVTVAPQGPAVPVPEAKETGQEAFDLKWAGLRQARKGDEAVGVVKEVCGRKVVLHMGRDVHVMHTVPEGQEIPKMQETQQQKGGIAR
jgi:hypothetical protein